jgi:hypothetical protein
MTVCLAALCEEGKAVVLVADKMVGKVYVEAELQISKLQLIHPHWFLMMSADDISPLFDLADRARDELAPTKDAPLETVMEVLQRNYEVIRMKRAEAVYLKPIGWTIERFTREGHTLPNYETIQFDLAGYELRVEVLIAGFDKKLTPPGKIFTMASANKGIPARCDIPAFAAIGSGATVAEYMMFYRDVHQMLPVRAAVYYALEAKYFGEQASGVGGGTDLYVLRFDGNIMWVKQLNDEKTIEKKLIPICQDLEPSDPKPEHIETLNTLQELDGLPLLPIKRKREPNGKKKGKKS